jgi:glutathionylspermidine synthase
VAQWFWLQEVHPGADQFNSIHERLIEAWRRWRGKPVYFSSIKDQPEDEQTVLYLRDTCTQAGVETRSVYIEDLGWNRKSFVDLEFRPVEYCFKLYPWEWLWQEDFGIHLATAGVQFIEPAWKMLLSNKGILPILWELFPEHPNLLPAYGDAAPLGGHYIRKPKLSREGSNVRWIEGAVMLEETDGDYGGEGYIYQAPASLPVFEGNRPVFGVWVIDHEAAGLGIREDRRRITSNLSRFVPHYFR